MTAIKKNRFSLSEENQQETPEGVKTNRFNISGTGKKKLHPAIIPAIVAAVAVAALIVVTLVYREPPSFLSSSRVSKDDLFLSKGDTREAPGKEFSNPRLRQGIQSYEKKFYRDAIAEFTGVVQSDAPDKEKAIALTYMGMIYDEQGDTAKAIESYTRALKYNSESGSALKNLAIAHRHRGDYSKALGAIDEALEQYPDTFDYLLLKGNILYEMDNYEKAVQAYRMAIDAENSSPSAHYNMALALQKSGDEVSAIDYLKKAGSIDQSGNIASMAYGRLGTIFTKRGDYQLAEKYLSMAAKIDPAEPLFHYNLGITYLKQDNPQKALESFHKAEALGVKDENLLENLGEAYASLQQYDKSLEVYERLKPLQENNVRILSRIAELYYRKGELDRAYDYYKKITTLEPASENARIAYLNMGNILDDQQQFRDAIDAYQKALSIDPKDDTALYNLGIAYDHAGIPEKAVETWNRAASLNPDKPGPLLAIANMYYEGGHYNQAMDEYVRILRRWPNIQEAQFKLGTIYYRKNQPDYAIDAFNRVIEIQGDNELARKAYINKGVILANRETDESLDQARQSIQKALLIKPGDPQALLSMGTILMQKNMYDDAIELFHQALQATNDETLMAESYHNLGKCHYKKENYKKSLQFFTQSLELDPSREDTRINRKVTMEAYEKELSMD
ncbi:MAG: tetratricopeptide repeat protein [Spirochaetota bacterium]